jgi:hypothetical protein
MPKMERNAGVIPVKITSDVSTSQVIPFHASAGGVLIAESGSGTVQWSCLTEPGGTPFPLYDEEGNRAETLITEGNAVALPGCVYSCSYLVGEGADIEGYLCASG